jgi:hypothetical protein
MNYDRPSVRLLRFLAILLLLHFGVLVDDSKAQDSVVTTLERREESLFRICGLHNWLGVTPDYLEFVSVRQQKYSGTSQSVSGKVLNPSSLPVPNALILIRLASQSTEFTRSNTKIPDVVTYAWSDGDGNFSLDRFRFPTLRAWKGTPWEIIVVSEQGAVCVKRYKLSGGQISNQEFKLEPPVSIKGTLVGDNGNPVPSGFVTLCSLIKGLNKDDFFYSNLFLSELPGNVACNERGEFQFDGMPSNQVCHFFCGCGEVSSYADLSCQVRCPTTDFDMDELIGQPGQADIYSRQLYPLTTEKPLVVKCEPNSRTNGFSREQVAGEFRIQFANPNPPTVACRELISYRTIPSGMSEMWFPQNPSVFSVTLGESNDTYGSTSKITVDPETLVASIPMVRPVSILVTDRETARPVENASIDWRIQRDRPLIPPVHFPSPTTNAQGSAVMYLPVRPIEVFVFGPLLGYQTAFQRHSTATSEPSSPLIKELHLREFPKGTDPLSVEFALPPVAPLTITVTDASSRPLELPIEVYFYGVSRRVFARTDNDGKATVPQPPTPWFVLISDVTQPDSPKILAEEKLTEGQIELAVQVQ